MTQTSVETETETAESRDAPAGSSDALRRRRRDRLERLLGELLAASDAGRLGGVVVLGLVRGPETPRPDGTSTESELRLVGTQIGSGTPAEVLALARGLSGVVTDLLDVTAGGLGVSAAVPVSGAES